MPARLPRARRFAVPSAGVEEPETTVEARGSQDASRMSNPNSIGAKLMKTDLDIFINDIEVGKANQRLYTEIGPNSEFTIPVKCDFSAKDLLKDQGNTLGGLLNALVENKVDLTYKGTVRLKIAGLEFDVPVDYEQEIKLK